MIMRRTLGDTILSAIELKNMTQKQVAAALHISATTLNGYIKNHRIPDPETLGAIASYLDLDLNELYRVKQNKEQNAPLIMNQEEARIIRIYRQSGTETKALLRDLFHIIEKRSQLK